MKKKRGGGKVHWALKAERHHRTNQDRVCDAQAGQQAHGRHNESRKHCLVQRVCSYTGTYVHGCLLAFGDYVRMSQGQSSYTSWHAIGQAGKQCVPRVIACIEAMAARTLVCHGTRRCTDTDTYIPYLFNDGLSFSPPSAWCVGWDCAPDLSTPPPPG